MEQQPYKWGARGSVFSPINYNLSKIKYNDTKEKYIQSLENKKDKSIKDKQLYNPFYREIQEGLQKLLGTKVSISKGNKKGKIEIEYYSDDELARIIQIINANK